MKSVLIPLAAVVALSSGVSLAADQPQSTSPRAACKADVEKFCSGVQPGGGRIVGCLKQNEAQVSASCKDAIAKARERKVPPTSGSTPG
jgi:Cysteine rich repeat